MRKVMRILLWLVLIGWMTVMTGFIGKTADAELCKEIHIEVSDSADLKFVTAEMVRDMLEESAFELQGYPVMEINTRELETLLLRNEYVKEAEVFVNVEGDLKIELNQRKALMRIMPREGNGMYVDEEGFVMSLSETYAPLILPVTGYVELETRETDDGLKVDVESGEEMAALMDFAAFVQQDPFWSTQIVQVYKGKKGDYEIIPRVGAHQIVVGELANFEEKLRNLKLLYEQGLEQYGWNTYNKINLKYSDQIICTKR